MRAYLEDVGGAGWLDRRLEEADGAPNPGELLVEFGGRACYRSWEPGLNVQRHARAHRPRRVPREHPAQRPRQRAGARQLLVRAAQRSRLCYDAETEVLTSEGWKAWPDVDGTELFATVNPDDDTLNTSARPSISLSVRRADVPRALGAGDLPSPPTPDVGESPWHAGNGCGEEPYRVGGTGGPRQARGLPKPRATDGTVTIPDQAHVAAPRIRRRRSSDTTSARRSRSRSLHASSATGSRGLNGDQICMAQNRGPELDAMAANVVAMGLKTAAHYSMAREDAERRATRLARNPWHSTTREAVPSYVRLGPEALRVFLEAFVDGDGSRRRNCNDAHLHRVARAGGRSAGPGSRPAGQPHPG